MLDHGGLKNRSCCSIRTPGCYFMGLELHLMTKSQGSLEGCIPPVQKNHRQGFSHPPVPGRLAALLTVLALLFNKGMAGAHPQG